MNQLESVEEKEKDTINQVSLSSDIDQLCNLIDTSTFGGCVQR